MIYDRWVVAPLFKDRVGGNGRIKHPLGYTYILNILIGRRNVVITVNPPCAESTVAVEYAAVVFKACQVLLFGRP